MLAAPFLRRVDLLPERMTPGEFPFTLPFLAAGRFRLELTRPVTFLVGENGSGKSTLLEAVARHCGFNPQGGSRDNAYGAGARAEDELAAALRLSWRPKVTNGLFFRAESFFAFARHLDAVSSGRYAERDLHELSHGESFLSLFENRLGTRSNAIYLLDEPEAALSPARQLVFLRLLHRWHRSERVQAIIATHSPILIAYPHATILAFDDGAVREMSYRETEHYRLTSAFLAAPERTLRHLLAEDGDEEEATH